MPAEGSDSVRPASIQPPDNDGSPVPSPEDVPSPDVDPPAVSAGGFACQIDPACGCADACVPVLGSQAPSSATLATPYVGTFIVDNRGFRRWDGERYQPFFLKGVVLTVTVPGTAPGDFAASYEDYRHWLDMMRALGMNALRVYTLHFPHFYRALADHNDAHPDEPLYLLQGAWLSEAGSLEEETEPFHASIRETIDAIHGQAILAERAGKASGEYTVDVSRWVAGYLIGREVLPEEVLAHDVAFPERTSFAGVHFRLAAGTPTEVWAAEQLEYAVAHERTYNASHPVAFSSWHELDPLEHPTEPDASRTDVAHVDLANLEVIDAPAGHFISYHIYPYWPLYVGEDPTYRQCSDAYGSNGYLAYARALKQHYRAKAVLVGEYGAPGGVGIAKFSSTGMHHGGHSESEQGTFAARMLGNLFCSGYAGAMYFHWMDGWHKRVWITARRTVPSNRLRLWHDMTNPQQHYGLLAFVPETPALAAMPMLASSTAVKQIAAAANAEYFELEVQLDRPLVAGESMVVGLDTYSDGRGESVLPDGRQGRLRHELAVVLTAPDHADLKITAAYDSYGIERGGEVAPASIASDGGKWNDVRWQTMLPHESDDGVYVFPGADHAIGRLTVSAGDRFESSQESVAFGQQGVRIRLPWTLLNFADPSTRSVLDDQASTARQVETVTSAGIAVAVSMQSRSTLVETQRFSWSSWDRAPVTTERLKGSAPLLRQALQAIPADSAQ